LRRGRVLQKRNKVKGEEKEREGGGRKGGWGHMKNGQRLKGAVPDKLGRGREGERESGEEK